MKACQAGGTRVHSLTKKSDPLCLHTYLIFKAGLESGKPKSPVAALHEIDRNATVLEVTRLIKEHFPTATSDCRQFLKKNKKFIESLCKVKNSELNVWSTLSNCIMIIIVSIICSVCIQSFQQVQESLRKLYS